MQGLYRQRLLKAEAFSVEDSKLKPVLQQLLAAVIWQQQRIEACVAGWELQAISAIPLNDASHAPQSTDGRPVTACKELEK